LIVIGGRFLVVIGGIFILEAVWTVLPLVCDVVFMAWHIDNLFSIFGQVLFLDDPWESGYCKKSNKISSVRVLLFLVKITRVGSYKEIIHTMVIIFIFNPNLRAFVDTSFMLSTGSWKSTRITNTCKNHPHPPHRCKSVTPTMLHHILPIKIYEGMLQCIMNVMVRQF
jgi:hypothetical protein